MNLFPFLKTSLKIIIAVILVVVLELFSYGYFNSGEAPIFKKADIVISGVNDSDQKMVLGEETTASEAGVVLTSEDYKIKQVTMGGNMDMDVNAKGNDDPFKISDITNEIVTSKDKNDTRMVLAWKTNRSAISEVDYSKNGNNNVQKMKEDEYGYTHTIVMPSLEPASVYTYTIKSQDGQGNEDISDKFVFYTGSPNVSLLDVLENAAQKAFGWAIKK